MRLHLGDGLAQIRDGVNKERADLLIRSFFTAGQTFTVSDMVPRYLPPETPRLPSILHSTRGLQTCGQEISRSEVTGINPSPAD